MGLGVVFVLKEFVPFFSKFDNFLSFFIFLFHFSNLFEVFVNAMKHLNEKVLIGYRYSCKCYDDGATTFNIKTLNINDNKHNDI